MIVGDEKGSIDPDRPIVLTFYVPYFYPGLSGQRPRRGGTARLLTASFETIETRLREQMMVLFADGGFDPTRDVAGIILNRWGHAYTNPEPGFMFGVDGAEPVPDVIRKPFGRIAIGHSELGGHQNWTAPPPKAGARWRRCSTGNQAGEFTTCCEHCPSSARRFGACGSSSRTTFIAESKAVSSRCLPLTSV